MWPQRSSLNLAFLELVETNGACTPNLRCATDAFNVFGADDEIATRDVGNFKAVSLEVINVGEVLWALKLEQELILKLRKLVVLPRLVGIILRK